MSEQDNAQVGVETTETVETLTAKLEAEAKARAKAEAKIVDMKKSTTPEVKEEPKEEVKATGFDEDAFEKKYEEKKFFESNPDMIEYKDKLTEYTSKGIWWKEAKLLVESSDETIANRKVASQTNFTSWDKPIDIVTQMTKADLENLSQTEYNRAMELRKEGKLTITN